MYIYYTTFVAVPADASEETIQNVLQTNIPAMGSLEVTKTGTCANFNWTIKFISRTGDLTDISVSLFVHVCLSRYFCRFVSSYVGISNLV